MEKKVGIFREIDSNGRLVIPMELRKFYNLKGEVEIVACKDGVLVRNPMYELVRRKEEHEK